MGNGHVSRLLRLSRAGTLERLTSHRIPDPAGKTAPGESSRSISAVPSRHEQDCSPVVIIVTAGGLLVGGQP